MVDMATENQPAAAPLRCCNHCAAPIGEGEATTVTICSHLFCSSCTNTVFGSGSTCPVDGCGTKLTDTECLLRDSPPLSDSETEMLLVGYSSDTILAALSAGLAHSQKQQAVASAGAQQLAVAHKDEELARARAENQTLENQVQDLHRAIGELSSQLELERRSASSSSSGNLALLNQVNNLTRENNRLQELVVSLHTQTTTIWVYPRVSLRCGCSWLQNEGSSDDDDWKLRRDFRPDFGTFQARFDPCFD